ncbi:MAG: hypothetical protein WC444_07020 [Candidatus Paceibacterota bacterium]
MSGNIMDDLRQTASGIPPDPKMFFILNRWFSNEPTNAELCERLDKFSRGRANPELLCNMLARGVNKQKTFIPYIKKAKDEDEELVEELRRYYGMSTHEFAVQRKYMSIHDKKLLAQVATALGWDSKKCKDFGVEYVKPEVKKLPKTKEPQGKSLFNF